MEEKVDGLGYYNRMALYFVVAFLFVSSAFLPDEMALLKERSLASVAMILLGLLADAFLLFSVYITAEPVVPRHKDRLTAMLLSAAMLFACPGALVFSEIHIAAIALLWAQFCLLKEEYFNPASGWSYGQGEEHPEVSGRTACPLSALLRFSFRQRRESASGDGGRAVCMGEDDLHYAGILLSGHT